MIIRTWLADVSALQEGNRYQEYYQNVPDFRKEKADRLRMQSDKALSVGVWTLFERMKKEYHLQEPILYNFSHSGNYALCTIAVGNDVHSQLGCDIEVIGKEREAIAKKYFTPEEQAQDFYRIWVLKESFMKATRMGMKLPINAFSFAFDENDRAYLKKQPEQFQKQYYFKEYKLKELGYKIAVCADCDAFAEEIQVVKL